VALAGRRSTGSLMTSMAKVISLEEEREKRRKQKVKQFLDSLNSLRRVTPSEAKSDPKRKIALPYSPDDPDEPENFDRGRAAGQEGGSFNPKSTGAGYACGYLQGIIFRELNNEKERLAWLVDWHRFDPDIRKGGEVFDDELEKMPPRRPKRASQRVHDICIMLDMMFLTKRLETAGDIIAEIMRRYFIEDRSAWKLWDTDVDFVPWLKPSLSYCK
jgi:hypothetical protein